MLSREEQEKIMKDLSDIYSKVNRHKFHYVLEKMGLRKKVEAVVKELKEAGLSVKGYELHDESSEIYILLKDGRITLDVYAAPPIPLVSFRPHLYEVRYGIKSTNLNNADKASEVLKRHKFNPVHETGNIVPSPRFLNH